MNAKTWAVWFDGAIYSSGFATEDEAWLLVVCHKLDMLGEVAVREWTAE